MTRFLNVPLDVSDDFLMTFMILLDFYMEPTSVGSDIRAVTGSTFATTQTIDNRIKGLETVYKFT